MLIGMPAETDAVETHVAASPETVKKFTGLGAEVAVEHGAGLEAGVVDSDYQAAGARLVSAAEALGADSGSEGPEADRARTRSTVGPRQHANPTILSNCRRKRCRPAPHYAKLTFRSWAPSPQTNR